MAEKKQESFIVTDRRLFTSEGELRKEVSEEEVSSAPPTPPPAKEPAAMPKQTAATEEAPMSPAPSARSPGKFFSEKLCVPTSPDNEEWPPSKFAS